MRSTFARASRNLILISIGILILLVSCMDGMQPLAGRLPIEAPRVAYAGDEINITVGPVTANNGTPVGLVMVGTYGPKVYNTVFQSGIAHFTIPSKDTRQPGYLALIAASDEARGEASIILYSQDNASVESIGQMAGVSTPNNRTTR